MSRKSVSPPVDVGEELVVIPRGGVRKLKFTWTRLAASFFFNIREWRQADDGVWWPTPKKGLGIGVSELPALFEAVILAAEKALSNGCALEDADLLRELQAIVNGLPKRLDTKPQLDTVRHEPLDTAQTLNIEGWTVRQDKRGFYKAFRKIRGAQKCVYIGKSLDGAAEKVHAANETWGLKCSS